MFKIILLFIFHEINIVKAFWDKLNERIIIEVMIMMIERSPDWEE